MNPEEAPSLRFLALFFMHKELRKSSRVNELPPHKVDLYDLDLSFSDQSPYVYIDSLCSQLIRCRFPRMGPGRRPGIGGKLIIS